MYVVGLAEGGWQLCVLEVFPKDSTSVIPTKCRHLGGLHDSRR